MAKKIFQIANGENIAKGYQDADGEMVVKFYAGKKYMKDADYFTCDLEDAENTAKAEVDRMKIQQ